MLKHSICMANQAKSIFEVDEYFILITVIVEIMIWLNVLLEFINYLHYFTLKLQLCLLDLLIFGGFF